jgi:hypothetical protein
MRCDGWFGGFGLAALVTLVGCSHRVEVAYTQAAQVNLGADVRQVLVVERVGAGNTGESVIDFAEGVLTGEGLEGDRDATSAAVDGLVRVLGETGRFEVTEIRLDGRKVDENLFGGAMAPKQVVKMCEKQGCDAIVAIDALDTDTTASITPIRTSAGLDYDGRADTTLAATFRVYDADGALKDESRVRTGSTATVDGADTQAEAAAAVAVTPQLQVDLAWDAGAEYARRISPHAVVDTRRLYVTGHKDLREAWDHARAGDWKGAQRIWTALARTGDEKDAAKATYNLAVVRERRGKLDEARTLARDAAADLGSSRARTYVATLGGRIRNEARVERQMAPEPASIEVTR